MEKDNTFHGGATENVNSVRSGQNINNGDVGADSALTAVLGRMAAHSGKPLSWAEMMRSNDRIDVKLAI